MRVTLKQIAEMAGVSRGTVDRALYDRGRVNPEVAKKIKKIAKELGYQPNTAGRALALSKNPIKVGVIIQSHETPFMTAVLRGVQCAAEEIELLGGEVIVRQIRSIHPEQVMEAMDELKQLGVNGIALVPSDDEKLAAKIDLFIETHKIPIVTVNTDLEDSKRICYIGQDAMQSGKAAAGLMGEILGGKGLVSIVSGYAVHPALQKRVKGFETEIRKCFPEIQTLPIEYAHDDDARGKEIARRQLSQYPRISGFFITSNEDCGICEVLKENNLEKDIKVICYDLTEKNVENLKAGAINFLIGQDAYFQGYEPVNMLFQMFFQGRRVESGVLYTEIDIKNKYNL